jgi:ornithine--oxo-acid transaminase
MKRGLDFLSLEASHSSRGLLAKETHGHTIRISPPLILTCQQADWIADQFAAVLG